MPAATDNRRTIASLVHRAQHGGYEQNGTRSQQHTLEVRATARGVAQLDWNSYTDDQIQGLARMCSNDEAGCVAEFKNDVTAEVGRRGLGPKGLGPHL